MSQMELMAVISSSDLNGQDLKIFGNPAEVDPQMLERQGDDGPVTYINIYRNARSVVPDAEELLERIYLQLGEIPKMQKECSEGMASLMRLRDEIGNYQAASLESSINALVPGNKY